MEYPAAYASDRPFVPASAPAPAFGSIRLLIADPALATRDRLALVLGAMGGTSVVCRASSAYEVGRWVAAHPFGWDVALVDAGIAADPACGLRYCGSHVWVHQTVFVLADDAPPLESGPGDPALVCYDKRRDLGLIVARCIRLRDDRSRRVSSMSMEHG